MPAGVEQAAARLPERAENRLKALGKALRAVSWGDPGEPEWVELRMPEGRWRVDARRHDELFDEVGLRWEFWQRQGWCQIVKQSVHRTIVRAQLPGGPVFLKHYHASLWSWFRHRLWLSKAEQEWRGAHLLQRSGIATITPLAVGELEDGSSYFLSEDLADAWPLSQASERMAGLSRYQERVRYRMSLAISVALPTLPAAGT